MSWIRLSDEDLAFVARESGIHMEQDPKTGRWHATYMMTDHDGKHFMRYAYSDNNKEEWRVRTLTGDDFSRILGVVGI